MTPPAVRRHLIVRRSRSSGCSNLVWYSPPASLWEELGIGPAIRRCAEQAKLTAPHETALFAMAANRLDDPVSKLACAERWLPDIDLAS